MYPGVPACMAAWAHSHALSAAVAKLWRLNNARHRMRAEKALTPSRRPLNTALCVHVCVRVQVCVAYR